MQRLFGTFPDSAPGVGLLLLRFTAAVPLIAMAIGRAADHANGSMFLALVVGLCAAGLLLIVGLWTPFIAPLQSVATTWIAFSAAHVQAETLAMPAIGVSLILLGPGAWSMDAYIFGRKRLVF